jgi:hypothetical protein
MKNKNLKMKHPLWLGANKDLPSQATRGMGHGTPGIGVISMTTRIAMAQPMIVEDCAMAVGRQVTSSVIAQIQRGEGVEAVEEGSRHTWLRPQMVTGHQGEIWTEMSASLQTTIVMTTLEPATRRVESCGWSTVEPAAT